MKQWNITKKVKMKDLSLDYFITRENIKRPFRFVSNQVIQLHVSSWQNKKIKKEISKQLLCFMLKLNSIDMQLILLLNMD